VSDHYTISGNQATSLSLFPSASSAPLREEIPKKVCRWHLAICFKAFFAATLGSWKSAYAGMGREVFSFFPAKSIILKNEEVKNELKINEAEYRIIDVPDTVILLSHSNNSGISFCRKSLIVFVCASTRRISASERSKPLSYRGCDEN